LDKFESRSSNRIFLGYALHSHSYRVLILETNHTLETCEATFDETSPSPSPVFEHVGPHQMGETIFVEEEHVSAVMGDLEPTPLAALVKPTSTTLDDRPNMTSSMT
jgi:hypothetical protein